MKRRKKGVSNNIIHIFALGINKVRKVLTVVALVGLLWGYIPWNEIIAETIDEAPSEIILEDNTLPSYPTTTDTDFDPSQVAIDSEIIDKRTETTKIFRKIDGTYEVAIYNEVIHYYEDGKYKQVDNSLYDNGNNEFENSHNKFKVKFPKKLDDNKQIKLTLDKYSIDWNIININASDIEFDDTKTTPNNIKELVNINQLITYKNIQHSVDVEYILTGSKIKENVILNSYIEDFSLSFEYKIKDLELVTDEFGNILFVNEDNEIIFTFDSLYMIDNNMNESFNVSFDYTQTGNKEYLITITPDDEWLQNAVYPVKIDPTLVFYGDSNMITDKYVYGSTSSSTSSLYNKVGLNGSYHYRSYLEFDLTQVPSNIMINFAHLKINTYPSSNYCNSDCTILAKEVLSSYGLSNITGEGMSITDPRVIDYEEVYYSDGDDGTYRFDITRNFQKWLFDGYDSRIIELRKENESSTGYIILQSENYNMSTGPVLEIGYEYTNGIHDYWTYNTQPISTAGIGYVSDYTGKMSLTRTDISFSTEIQSLGLSLIYNINDRDTNIGYGAGWRSNYNIEARIDTSNNDPYSIDATGAKTYYVGTACDSRFQDGPLNDYTCYFAEDGSRNLYITVKEPGMNDIIDYYIVTLEQVYYYFGYDGYLDTIYDEKSGTTTAVEYNIIGNKVLIDSITDDSGNYIDLTYNGNNNLEYSYLYVITNDSPEEYDLLEKVHYTYTYQSSIADYTPYYVYKYTDFLDDEVFTNDYFSYYNHDSYGRLTEANSSFGAKVIYQYNTSINKVSNIKSYINSSLIGEIDYTYDFKKTTLTNQKGDVLTYWFDNYGHTIQVMTDEGYVQTFKYMNIFSPSSANETYVDIIGTRNYRQNHIKIYESNPIYSYLDPVLNGGFENYGNHLNDLNWGFVIDDLAGSSPSYINTTYSDSESVYGDYSAYMSGSYGQDYHYEQDIVLDAGTYNISGYVNLHGTDSSAFITVDGVSFDTSEIVYAAPNDEWTYLDLPFTVVNDNTIVTINLNRVDGGSGGYAYFDSIQLIEGYKNTRTNLFENSSFENALNNWTLSSSRVYRTSAAYNSGVYEKVLGDYSIAINGDEDINSYASYDITSLLDLSSDNIYTINIWSKSLATPLKIYNSLDERVYRLRIEYTTVSGTVSTHLNFDPSLEEWQKLSKEIIVDSTITNIEIYLEYKGLGYVYFDGLTIESGLSGKYIEVSSGGNIIKTTNSNSEQAEYDYLVDNSGQITEKPLDSSAIYIETINNEIEIPLDSNGRPEYIMNNNVRVTPTYDSNGNVTQLKYGDTTNYFTTSTIYSSGKFYQYKQSSTDEFGMTTSYDFSLVTGLLQSITNVEGYTVEYEYYDDGLLHKVMNNDYCNVDNTSECADTEYVYNSDNMLYRIIMKSGYYYEITYDNQNRMIGVYVKNDTNSYNNQLMGYSYIYEDSVYTSKIDTQSYGNGDFINFAYDDNDRVSSIQYSDASGNPKTRFSYEYDQLGRIAILNTYNTDEYVIYTEYYTYDITGNLVKISDNEGNKISYSYDESGNLTSLDFDINTKSQETKYFYNKYLDYDGTTDDLQSSLYNKTTYTTEDSQGVTKEYFYENNALYKLDYIELINGTFTIAEDFVYIDDTTRIYEVIYNIDKTSNGNTSDDLDILYRYYYDFIGNISSVYYYEDDSIKTYEHYEYDEMNQLHIVDSRDYAYSSTVLNETNYTKYYYYDQRGNITDIKTFFFGEEDLEEATPPSGYETSTGSVDIYVVVSGYTMISVGDSLSLSYSYYLESNSAPVFAPMLTLCDNSVNTNVAGFYLLECNGFALRNSSTYNIDFGIVIQVGTPMGGINVPEEHIRYYYSDSWLDQLTKIGEVTYNGTDEVEPQSFIQEYSYDSQGNPTEITEFYYNNSYYDDASLEYDGRQLVGIELTDSNKSDVSISYGYNDQGYRTSKTVDDSTIQYHLQGDKVLYETDGTYGIIYTYDIDGKIISFNYDSDVDDSTSGIEYFYLRNIQGDITKIINKNGNVVVEYYYDAWGNITNTNDTSDISLAEINPYRYRGYRYDEETELYYLNSRYYNPVVGRFINSDGLLGRQGNILGHNMYAYTQNNPVMYSDISGYAPQWYNPFSWRINEDDVTDFFKQAKKDVQNASNHIYGWANDEFFEIFGAMTLMMYIVSGIPKGKFIPYYTITGIVIGASIMVGIHVVTTVGSYLAIKGLQWTIDSITDIYERRSNY